MKKERKRYSAEEKMAILRRHLVDKEPVSKLCDELGLQPSLFYRWRKEFFENERKGRSSQSAEQERIAYLEKKVQTKHEVLAELMAEHVGSKKCWGTLRGRWVRYDVQEQVVDFVRGWSEKTGIGVARFVKWLGIAASKFYSWRQRCGRVNEHNGWVPRDFWLEEARRQRQLRRQQAA